MDPQAAWTEILAVLVTGEINEAETTAQNLLDWLNRGGFPPQIFSCQIPADWSRLVCRILCREILLVCYELKR